MEGGYARWWEVVVQRRVTWLCLLGARKERVTSISFVFQHVLIVSLWVSCLRVSHSTTLMSSTWENPQQ